MEPLRTSAKGATGAAKTYRISIISGENWTTNNVQLTSDGELWYNLMGTKAGARIYKRKRGKEIIITLGRNAMKI